MYDPNHNASPFNPLPPVVVALAAVIALVEIAFQLGARGLVGGPEAVGWRIQAAQQFGFSDALFSFMWQTGTSQLEAVTRMFTYPFIHGGFANALFGCVLLLALGNFASQVFRPPAIALTFFLCAAVGALAHGLLLDTQRLLIGAFPPVYGILGLYTWLLWVEAEELGRNRWPAFRLIGFLVAIQVIFGLIGGSHDALVSELAGFATGFLIATPLAPGGLRRLRDRLRG